MKKHLNRAVNLALLMLFSFSLMTLVVRCLGCTVQPAFYLWVALLCISTWLTTCTRNGMWVGLPLSALLLFGASRFFPSDLSQQLNDVFDRLTGAYMEQILFPGEKYNYLNAASEHSLLLLFLTFLLASYMGAAISSRSGRVGLSLLGSVPFFITCLAVTVRPPVLSVLGMLLFWFLLSAGGSHFDEESNAYLRILGVLLPLSLLLSLLLVYIKPDEYEYVPERTDINTTLDQWLQSLDSWLNKLPTGERLSEPDAALPSTEIEDESTESLPQRPPVPWQDQRGDMDLTKSLDRSELEKTLLQIRAEQAGSIYLRTVSYGEYLGTGWAQTEEGLTVPSLPFTAYALGQYGSPERTLSIRSLQESVYRYIPYFSEEEGGYDSFVPSRMQNSYTVSYRLFPDSFDALQIPAAYAESEAGYRAFAHEYYTRLPASTRDALQAICEENGLYAGMNDPVTQVASFVQRTGTYTLQTAPYPSDDYAIYFLTTAQEGYCVHFATAAVVLYRYLGIPARITEGFLIEASAGRYCDVKGYQAHAWVEIYRDGVGWLPVEVTGQSGLDTDALGAGETPPSSFENSPEDSQTEVTPLETTTTEAPPLPVGLLTQSTTDTASSTGTGSAVRILLSVLLLILLVSALPLRRMVILSLRNRRFEQKDTRKAVIAMYRTALEAERYGAELPEQLLQSAERAAFSQHAISAEEVEACRDQLYILLKSSYLKQNTWQKLRFKFLHALL